MQRRDLVFSILLVVAIGATLAIKRAANDFRVTPDAERLLRDLAGAMARGGYRVVIERHLYQSDVVIAERGPCHLRIRDATLASDFDRPFRVQSSGLPRFAYYHHGRLLPEPPTIPAQLGEYAARTATRLGWATDFSPPIAVAASPACDLAMLPLAGVRMHFRR